MAARTLISISGKRPSSRHFTLKKCVLSTPVLLHLRKKNSGGAVPQDTPEKTWTLHLLAVLAFDLLSCRMILINLFETEFLVLFFIKTYLDLD